jgi:hypothetical protein
MFVLLVRPERSEAETIRACAITVIGFPLYPDSCDSCDSWSPTFRGSPQANTTTSQPAAIRPRITPIEQMVGSFEQCSSYSSGQSGLKRRLSERAQLPSSASPLYPDSCDSCDSWSPTFRGSPQANTTTSQPAAIRPRITPIERMVGSWGLHSAYASGQGGLKWGLSERAQLPSSASPLYPDSCDSCDSWSPTFRGSPQANTTTSQPVAIRPRITRIERMVGSWGLHSAYASGQGGLKWRLSERAQLPSSASPLYPVSWNSCDSWSPAPSTKKGEWVNPLASFSDVRSAGPESGR